MKVKLFVPLLIIVNSTFTFSEISFALDETLQTFREDVLEYQSNTMIQLDESFFRFYEDFLKSLNRNIDQRIIALNESFKKSCSEFPWFNLESIAARRLINACDESIRFISRAFSFRAKVMSQIFPDTDTLTTKTLLELIAEDYFTETNKYLDFVVPVYNQNPTCMISAMKKFLEIIKDPVNEMIKMNKKLMNLVGSGMRNDLRFVEKSFAKMFYVSNTIMNCSNNSTIDTYGCLGDIVAFDCNKRKSGCGPVYKSIYIALSHMRRIETFYETHLSSLDKIFRTIKETENVFLRWSAQVDRCIV